MMFNNGTLSVRVARIEEVTPEIRRLTLVSQDGQHLPAFSGGSHTVITGEDDHPWMLECLRGATILAGRYPNREFFETPQCAVRFGELPLPVTCGGGDIRVGCRDRGETRCLAAAHSAAPLMASG